MSVSFLKKINLYLKWFYTSWTIWIYYIGSIIIGGLGSVAFLIRIFTIVWCICKRNKILR